MCGLTPRLVPPPPSAAGRGSGEDEAQHPGSRVQDQLAVGSPGRGGRLHWHSAVSAAGACPFGPWGFWASGSGGSKLRRGSAGITESKAAWAWAQGAVGTVASWRPSPGSGPLCPGRNTAGVASSPSFREKLELWVFRASLVPAWEQLEEREMAPGIGGEARPREAAAWGMMERGRVNAHSSSRSSRRAGPGKCRLRGFSAPMGC